MRLYEYARSRGLETADVSAAAESLGFNPHPSSGLSDDEQAALDAHFDASPSPVAQEPPDGAEHIEVSTQENATTADDAGSSDAETGDATEDTAEGDGAGRPPTGRAQDAPPPSADKTPPARRPKTGRPPADQTRPHPAAMLP